MLARKSRSAKRLLCFIYRLLSGHTQNKSCLVPSSSGRSYAVTIVPPFVNSFARIQEVQLHNLKAIMHNFINQVSINRVKPKLTAQLITIEWHFTCLIWKSRIPRHNNSPSCACCCHSSDIKALSPLFVYPFERKWVTYFVRLLSILGTCQQRETYCLTTSNFKNMNKKDNKKINGIHLWT